FFRQFLAFFGVHQMALSLFRFIAAVGRTLVIANTLGTFTMLVVFVLGGFIIAKNDIRPFMLWGYYVSPMMYGQNAIVMNEFLDKRWSAPNLDPRINEPTVGKVLLSSRGFFTEDYWFWICIGALFGFSLLFNVLFVGALTWLNPLGDSKTVLMDEEEEKKKKKKKSSAQQSSEELGTRSLNMTKTFMDDPMLQVAIETIYVAIQTFVYTIILYSMIGFQLTAAKFLWFYYYMLLCFIYFTMYGMMVVALTPSVQVAAIVMAFFLSFWNLFSGFLIPRPTTLMDVLAGRKTGGYIEGSISISGFPKNQATFARISGYCEQNDIHSPYVTVYESLLYSAWLRLSSDVKPSSRKVSSPVIVLDLYYAYI
ncbi:hypothetical protein CRG98_030230, partial [Punica granatum]